MNTRYPSLCLLRIDVEGGLVDAAPRVGTRAVCTHIDALDFLLDCNRWIKAVEHHHLHYPIELQRRQEENRHLSR